MSGFVYFIEAEGSGYVKIGWAKYSPFSRLSELQTGCPNLLFVRAFFPGSREDEARMHRTFADLRGRGEWFASIFKLEDFLNYLEGDRPIDAAATVSSIDRVADALQDCVMTGMYYPDSPYSEKVYDESGDWRPWAHLLCEGEA